MNRVLFTTSISATAAVGVVAAAQLFQGLAPAAGDGRVEAASAASVGAAAVPSPPEADVEPAGADGTREAAAEPAGADGTHGGRGATAVESVAAVEQTAAEGEGLIVVAPTLDMVASLSGGVPSIFQVGGSLVTARLALLPSEVAGPVLDAYVDGVDVVTQGAQGVGQTAEALSAATEPLGTAFNEPANAVASTGVSALVAGTDGAGAGAEVAGVHTNLFDYSGQTAQSSASAFGIDGSQNE